MELTLGNYKAQWSDIGEGMDGDYNPDNPDDVALLRFDTYEMVDGKWESIDDGSYCTAMPVGADESILKAGLEYLLRELSDLGGRSPKKMLEGASWMSPDWFS